MSRSGSVVKRGEELEVHIAVDHDGVCRVVQASHEKVELTMEDLGRLLTGIIKVLVSDDEQEDQVDVNLN
jgi:hypothetical protein